MWGKNCKKIAKKLQKICKKNVQANIVRIALTFGLTVATLAATLGKILVSLASRSGALSRLTTPGPLQAHSRPLQDLTKKKKYRKINCDPDAHPKC